MLKNMNNFISLEINKSEQLKSFMKKVENKKLEHYSSKQGLQTIDPKHIGSGIGSRQERNAAHPHSFYYRPEAVKEDFVTGQAKSKYIVDIPEEAKIYDISRDEHGFAKQIRAENNGAFSMDAMHQKLKESGYHGFEMTAHPNEEMRGVVGLYHAMPVKQEAKIKE